MKLRMFSLKDVKADVFGSPFVFAKVELAKRMVRDLARDSNSMLSRHPEDFHLYEIGSWEDTTGVVAGESLVSHGSAFSLMGTSGQNGVVAVQLPNELIK